MKDIQLDKGEKTIVSDEDFDFLSQWKWRTLKRGNTVYAVRHEYLGQSDGKRKIHCIYMHRVVAERAGMDISDCIDHRNHEGLDNQRGNLRPASRKQNQENRKVSDHNTSGFIGVTWIKNIRKWQARITQNRTRINLGYFADKNDAVAARREAEKEYWTHCPTT
jgi:hypothetical protein